METISGGVRLALGLLAVLVAAVLGGLAETIYVWIAAPIALPVAERLLLAVNGTAIAGVVAVALLLVLEGLAALGRTEGVPARWIAAARSGGPDGAIAVGSGILALALAAAVAVLALRPAHLVIAGFADPDLAATAGALLGPASLAVTAVVWLPVFCLLRIAGRRLRDARVPSVRRMAWLLTPSGAVAVLVVAAVAVGLASWILYEDVVRALALGRRGVALASPLVFLVAWRALPRWSTAVRAVTRLRWWGSLLVLAAVVGLAVWVTLATATTSQRLQAARNRHAPLGSTVLDVFARILDGDGDGHPTLLGSDCDDTDAKVHPGAIDAPGDGIDQDCFEGDLSRQVVSRVFPPQPRAPRASRSGGTRARIRNVVLVTVDAVRADHVGVYGYREHPTTPEIDRLAADSVVFERAYAAAPQTRRSVQSTLTGLYPRSVLWGRGFPHTEVSSRNLTLAEMLRARQIAPLAFYGGVYMTKTSGYFQGFELFDRARVVGRSAASRHVPSTGREVTDSAIGELGSRLEGRHGFFAWLHYTEPHAPYESHGRFRRFGRTAHARYCQEIAQADREVGRFVDAIRAAPGADETAILVASDHGEAFGEHGDNYHYYNLYEEEVHVPLVVHVPGVEPRRVAGVVSLVDLVPTVLDLLGVPRPARLHGRSLVDALLPEGTDGHRAVFMDAAARTFGAANKAAVVVGRHKLILNVESGTFELYDLDADPEETRNVFDEMGDRATELRRLLATFRAATEDPRNTARLFQRPRKKGGGTRDGAGP